QLMRLGDETVEESDRHHDRQYPQQYDGAGNRSPPPKGLIIFIGSPTAQPPCSVCRRNGERDQKQSGFENDEQYVVLIAAAAPPPGHDVANAVCRKRDVVRHSRPRLRRVDAGDWLQQACREILSTDVLDGIDEIVDPQVMEVDRSLTCG